MLYHHLSYSCLLTTYSVLHIDVLVSCSRGVGTHLHHEAWICYVDLPSAYLFIPLSAYTTYNVPCRGTCEIRSDPLPMRTHLMYPST